MPGPRPATRRSTGRTIRTPPRATVCTAHVFQQIPGFNRIFMGWYSQGTQVLDFVENPDGTVRFAEAGYFIPENANEWVSHVFKAEDNPDGTVTYYGATGDFNLGEAGRNAIDVYKVTLPPAPVAGDPNAPDSELGGRCAQRIRGSKKGDKLLGSIAGDRIVGRGGNDKLNGRAGDDCVKGSGGRDKVKGGSGRDKVSGGRGADKSKGGSGRDKVKGGSGRDRLSGGSGRDKLKSGGGSDRVKARDGKRDKVNCGRGRDRATVDANDRVRKCERVKRVKS